MAQNIFRLNVDVKNNYTADLPTFRQGDDAVIIFKVFDNGVEYNINSMTKAIVHVLTRQGTSLELPCTFVTDEGKRAIRCLIDKVLMAELGMHSVTLIMYENNTVVSVQPFNICIFNNGSGTSSFIELIQDMMRIIEDYKLDLSRMIKLSEKGVANGVATLDGNGKIPLNQMPKQFQAYLNHINEIVFKNEVHGIIIDDDDIMKYRHPNGKQNVGFAPDATGGSGSSNQVLSASVTVNNGIATIIYSGVPTVISQKWDNGDKNKAHFVLSGTSFNGNQFNVTQTGLHTLWYKDSNNNTYTVLFNVEPQQLEQPNITVNVVDGIVTVNIDKPVSIKKWAEGTRDIPYFQYNGTVFTGNSFTVDKAGTYTIYFKSNNGMEWLYVFNVFELDLGLDIIQKPISQLQEGSYFKWGEETYQVLEQLNGKTLVIKVKGIYKPFDITGSNRMNLNSSNNIMHYLNNEFYNSLPHSKDKIISSSWANGELNVNEIGSLWFGELRKPLINLETMEQKENSISTNAKVGLPSFSMLRKHGQGLLASGLYHDSDEQKLTNRLGVSSVSYYITTGARELNSSRNISYSQSNGTYLTGNPASSNYVHPMMYLEHSFIVDIDTKAVDITGEVVENIIYLTLSDSSDITSVKWDYGNKDISYFNNNGNDIRLSNGKYAQVYTPRLGEVTVYAKDFFNNETTRVFEIEKLDTTPVNILDEAVKSSILYRLGKSSSDTITISDCKSITNLDLYGIRNLEDLRKITNLRGLLITGIHNQIDSISLNGLESCLNLESIMVQKAKINNINALSGLQKLNTVWLNYLTSGTNVSILNKPNLKMLKLYSEGTLNGLASLTNIRNVENLALWSSNLTTSDLTSIISNSQHLTDLSISSSTMTTLPNFNIDSNIIYLEIYGFGDSGKIPITSINQVSSLTKLNAITVSKSNIINLNGLQSLSNLVDINITYNANLTDISAISTLNNLNSIRLNNNNIASFNAVNRYMDKVNILYLSNNANTNYPNKSNYPAAYFANSFDW